MEMEMETGWRWGWGWRWNGDDKRNILCRTAWAAYFRSKGIRFVFFSAKEEQLKQDAAAALAKEEEESRLANGNGMRDFGGDDAMGDEDEDVEEMDDEDGAADMKEDTDAAPLPNNSGDGDGDGDGEEKRGDDTDLLTTSELTDYLVHSYWEHAQDHGISPDTTTESKKITVGMVGYPNVGKSSIINV